MYKNFRVILTVFLHHLAWQQDPAGFKKRMDQYLTISNKHGVLTMFVFFDDCWNKEPKTGLQPEPKPGIHNSGWMQDPGQPASENIANFPALEKYVKDVMTHFKNDKRILLWDLYNEPGNSGKGNTSLPLLKQVCTWAKTVNPSQPISTGVWNWTLETLNAYQIAHSDVITYHDYTPEADHLKTIQFLKMFGRPLICTEYMARPRNSLFSNILPMLKKENVGAINWGFVSGKTNTIYAWDTPIPDGSEPKLWFHDIFRKDGTPYKSEETELIKSLTSK
ncbi:MAG: 1,4-beta-xylanase [Sphingobacteriaceae bacterium]|nr:MAG: 1,4-beta-xylanase [Sphingobacteriaceae bacterium]